MVAVSTEDKEVWSTAGKVVVVLESVDGAVASEVVVVIRTGVVVMVLEAVDGTADSEVVVVSTTRVVVVDLVAV